MDLCKNACFENENEIFKGEERKANSNQATNLEKRLKGNFVSEIVTDLSKWNLNDAEILCCPKDFVPTRNNLYKAKLKMKLDAFGRILPIWVLCVSKETRWFLCEPCVASTYSPIAMLILGGLNLRTQFDHFPKKNKILSSEPAGSNNCNHLLIGQII